MKENVIASPGLGLLATSTVILAGEPVGPVTVAPLSVVTPASFMPKTVGGVSSAMLTCVPAAGGNDETARAVRAEIGLVALGHHLLEAGAVAVAVEDVVERLGRRLVDRAAGEQIAVARRRVEQAEDLVELRARGALRRGLSAGVDDELR